MKFNVLSLYAQALLGYFSLVPLKSYIVRVCVEGGDSCISYLMTELELFCAIILSCTASEMEYLPCSSAKLSTPTTRKGKPPLSLKFKRAQYSSSTAWTSGFLSSVPSALTQLWSSTVCLSPHSRRQFSSLPSMKAPLAGWPRTHSTCMMD